MTPHDGPFETAARLRESLRSDLTTVASWIRSERECRFWTSTCVAYPIDLATLPDDIAFAEYESWTAVVGERPIAFGQLVSKEDGRLHLSRLIVAPELRGRGFGRFLTRTLLDKAQSRYPRAVSLGVHPENEPALRLYRSLGFIPMERPPEKKARVALYLEHRRNSS